MGSEMCIRDSYFYYFTHEPLGAPLGAFHAAEIAYVFDNLASQQTGLGELDQRLAELMSDYWVAFARTGRPEVEGAPKWPRYSANKPLHIEFSAEGAVRGKNSLGKRYPTLERLSASMR